MKEVTKNPIKGTLRLKNPIMINEKEGGSSRPKRYFYRPGG